MDFIDNEPMIKLITDKAGGIIPMLDEELRIPKGSERNFLERLAEKQASNKIYKPVLKNPLMFAVLHYAGEVTYDATGFMDKNRDTLNVDMIEMLQASTDGFMNLLYPATMELSTTDRKSTLGKQFTLQLEVLMKNLYRTEPHYIRCVKPNEVKAPVTFVPRNCFEQLMYSGVFEAVAIRKQGYPFRLSHSEFAERYSKICPEEIEQSSDVRATCAEIVRQTKLDISNVKVTSPLRTLSQN